MGRGGGGGNVGKGGGGLTVARLGSREMNVKAKVTGAGTITVGRPSNQATGPPPPPQETTNNSL